MVAGAFNHDYTPNFTTNDMFTKQKYRSVFGPFFILLHTNLPGIGVSECMAGVSRLNALREPSKIGYSALLGQNQIKFFKNPVYLEILDDFKRHFESHVEYDEPELMYQQWLDQPCPKRKLRLATDAQIKNSPSVLDRLDPIQLKLKHGEMLAPGKMRCTADLGVFRTQLTAAPFGRIKTAWSKDFDILGMTTRFVKSADQSIISQAFKDLWEGPDMYVYHSDDGCVAVNCMDGRLVFNDDIKACDGSHRTPLFNWLEGMLSEHEGTPVLHIGYIARAFQYLREPITFHNPEKFQEFVKYFYTTMRLYSGSTLTTTVNNLARLIIAIAFRVSCPEPKLFSKLAVMDYYIKAGEIAGYILKIQICQVPQDMQFLKHSCTSYYEPYVNLGTMIRGFGSYRGDLPGTGSLSVRAYNFNCGVVEGRKTWGNHVIAAAFAEAFPACGVPINEEFDKTEGTGFDIPIDDLCARYKCTEDDVIDFAAVVRNLQVGHCVNSYFADWLYTVDYTGIESSDNFQKHCIARAIGSSPLE